MKDAVSREAEKEYVKEKAEFEQWSSIILDAAYTQFYLTHKTLSSTVWYGAAYQVYNTLAVGLKNAAKIVSKEKDVSGKEFVGVDYTDEMDAICDALNVDVEDLYDNECVLTLERIETYVNKVLKNNPTDYDKEEKEKINKALTDLEAALGGSINLSIEQIGQLKQVIDLADDLINGDDIFGMITSRSDKFSEWMEDFEYYVDEIKNALNDGEITAKELSDLAKTAEKRAKDMMDMIKADLTKEELKQIEEFKKDLQVGVAECKEQMEAAINAAINGAKDAIGGIKNNRHPVGAK